MVSFCYWSDVAISVLNVSHVEWKVEFPPVSAGEEEAREVFVIPGVSGYMVTCGLQLLSYLKATLFGEQIHFQRLSSAYLSEVACFLFWWNTHFTPFDLS